MNTLQTDELSRIQVLILAGGQGERLLPLTRLRAKAAVPFGGAFRLIDFTLTNCLNSGLRDVSLLTQYLHEDLHSYIRQAWSEFWTRSGEKRSPLVCLPPVSGKRYRGTADAVLQNIPVISPKKPQHVLILAGDHVYRTDYRNLLRKHIDTDADLTISTIEHPVADATEFGVVEVDNDLKVTGFSEKPSRPRSLPQRPNTALVSMGIYVFKMEALVAALQQNCSDGAGNDFGRDIIPSFLKTARVSACNFHDQASNAPGYWRDIGTVDSYHAASMDLIRSDSSFDPNRDRDHSNSICQRRLTGNTWLTTRMDIMSSVNARLTDTVISDGVRVEGDAEVEDSVLLPGARVSKGARLRRVIVEEGVHVPEGFAAGWDLASDSKLYTITPGGIVVLSATPRLIAPKPLRFNSDNKATTLRGVRRDSKGDCWIR